MFTAAVAMITSNKPFSQTRAKLEEKVIPPAVEYKIIFRNEKEFREVKKKFIAEGPNCLKCVTDFDFTLTKFSNKKNQRLASCHKVIEDCGLLSDTYHATAKALQNKYYPLEIATDITYEQRVAFMVEWVTQAHDVLLTTGLTKTMISTAVASGLAENRIQLRDKTLDLLKIFESFGVPCLIFSAGIADVLEEVLKQSMEVSTLPSKVFVASNRCKFNDAGMLVGFEDPIFHVFNKKASAIAHNCGFFSSDANIENRMSQRKNLLLIGDSLGDLTMSDGILGDKDSIIRVGFLNDRPDRLPQYLEAYDVVILGDPGMDFVVDFISNICYQKV